MGVLTAPSMCLVPEWTERVANRLSESSLPMPPLGLGEHFNKALRDSRKKHAKGGLRSPSFPSGFGCI